MFWLFSDPLPLVIKNKHMNITSDFCTPPPEKKYHWALLINKFCQKVQTHKPIQHIWQHIFALSWSVLKKPPREFNFLPSNLKKPTRASKQDKLKGEVFSCNIGGFIATYSSKLKCAWQA